MEIDERPSEPIIVFLADKTRRRLGTCPVQDVRRPVQHRRAWSSTSRCTTDSPSRSTMSWSISRSCSTAPEDMYDLLVFIGAPARYVIKRVRNRQTGEIAAVTRHSSCR